MPSLSGLRTFFSRYALTLNDLVSLSIVAWVSSQLLSLGELPLSFFLLGVAAMVLGPRGDRNATGLRWWATNLGRRAGISVLVLGAMVFWKAPAKDAGFPLGAWCGLALFWFPPALRSRWAESLRFREACTTVGRASLLPASEGIMLGIGLIFTRRFWPDLCPSGAVLFTVWAVWICVVCALPLRFQTHGLKSLVVRLAVAIATISAWVVLQALGFQKGHGAILTLNSILLLTPYWLAWRFGKENPDPRTDVFRLSLVAGLAFLLFQPIAFPVVHGTGDALWYATMMADAMEQFRAGYFPFFAGQTVYQFNGSIYPYRVAPGVLYLGTGFDLLTWRSLGPVAVQNLMLTVWGVLSALVCYVCLAKLLPLHRWLCLAGAFLFIACPGVMSIVYNTDLYMSWTTVPFVPLAFTASALLFENPRLRYMVMLSASLGITWWGHTPIALWTTGLIAAIQLIRLFHQRRTVKSQWSSLLVGAGLFTAIAGFPVGIALLYPPEITNKDILFTQATAPAIVHFLREVFPDVLLPLKNYGRLLSSFQLGYSLWIVLGVSAFIAVRRKLWIVSATLGVALVLAVLLTPWPFIAEPVWSLVPAFVRNTTGNWVMNRLYLIFSAAIVIGAAFLLRDFYARISSRTRLLLSVFMAIGCVWSALEGAKFGILSARARRPADSGRVALLPENIIITRFAYLVFPQLPAYFSHGVVDPELEHRFYSDDGQLLWSNTTAVLKAAADHDPRVKETTLGGFSPISEARDVWRLEHPVSIKPDHRYLLQFEIPANETVAGVLQVIGSSLFREYELPIFGGAKSFGFNPGANNTLPVWTSEKSGDDVQVSIVAKAGSDLSALEKIHVHLIEYTSDILPARVVSWLPYRVKVDSPVGGWLETPRSYQQYWISSAGPGTVKRSPEALTLLKHPGKGEVEDLTYNIPLGYSILFWVSITTIGGLLFYLAIITPKKHLAHP